MVHGLSWATVTGSWLGKTPLVQVSTTWALTCPEMVHQETIMTREIEIWLSDSLSLIRLYKPHSDAYMPVMPLPCSVIARFLPVDAKRFAMWPRVTLICRFDSQHGVPIGVL